MHRFMKDEPIFYSPNPDELFPKWHKAHFFGYDGGGWARVWVFNVGRRRVPIHHLRHQEEMETAS